MRRAPVALVTALLAAAMLAGAVPGAVYDGAAQEAAASGSAAAPPDLTPLPGAAEPAALARPAAGVTTGDFVRMVLVLAAVLGAIYLLVLFIKRNARVRDGAGAGIALLGSRSLGGSRSLHLVQVGSGVYLVGATDQALNLIADLTDQEGIDPAAEHAAGNGAGRRFPDLLAEFGAAPRGSNAPGDFLRRQQERLQRLRRPPHAEDGGAAS